jgi:glutamate/tyrosine decarboxylase-like PLP-dependent enzyme
VSIVLDPNDWSAFRRFSHAALDDALDYLETLRERPVWREMPEQVQARLNEPLPTEPTPLDDIYRTFVDSILPYASGNTHPRFFGWVQGAGTPTGVVAELLAATMNPNVGGRNHGAVFVERAVLRWFCDLFGLPQAASGVLTVGASAANLIAVLVARTRALGAPAMLAPSLASRFRGIERADSIAFDFHKWLQVPYDAGALLVRDGELHRETFASTPSYLTRMPRGLASAQPWFTDFTVDLSRGFRALKIWFTIKEHGAKGLGAAIEANVHQARLLGDLIDADRDFELLAPVQLNIVCFRYRNADLDEHELDRFNDELVIALQESGEAVASSTTVGSHRAIRICIINHRTTDADLTYTLDAIKRLALTMRV